MRTGKTQRVGKITSNLETMNVRLPKEVVGVLDKLVKKGLFSNRSEAVREFCRDYLKEHRDYLKEHRDYLKEQRGAHK